MLMTALAALALSQDPVGAGVSSSDIRWSDPVPEAPAAPPVELPPLPQSALSDPHGYERSQCSPFLRDRQESLEACQSRVRQSLAAHLGDALPSDMAIQRQAADCRPGLEGQRALECDRPRRPSAIVSAPAVQNCRVVPQRQSNDRVIWEEVCESESGRRSDDRGLSLRLFGRD